MRRKAAPVPRSYMEPIKVCVDRYDELMLRRLAGPTGVTSIALLWGAAAHEKRAVNLPTIFCLRCTILPETEGLGFMFLWIALSLNPNALKGRGEKRSRRWVRLSGGGAWQTGKVKRPQGYRKNRPKT